MPTKKKKRPNKAHRNGITITELHDLFPNDETAEKWFIENRWPRGVNCPKCGSTNIKLMAMRKKRMKEWRCREKECRIQFSAKTESILHDSKIGFRKWVIAIYLFSTNLKGVSSLKLHRDIGVTPKTAWYMGHRIRKALEDNRDPYWTRFFGTVEVDEAYFGGKRKNIPKKKRELLTGRGSVGKAIVIAAKERDTNKV